VYFQLKQAEPMGGHQLRLRFEDGSSGSVDLSEYIEEGTIFAKLNDLAYFNTLRIEFGTLVWGELKLDIAPEALHEDATGRSISFDAKDRAVS
jgi:hypothetical protein